MKLRNNIASIICIKPFFLYLCFLFNAIPIFAQTSSIKSGNPAIILSEYIKIKSVQGNESKAGKFLYDYCKDKGLYVRLFSDSDSSYNFAASLYPLDLKKPNIILLNHLDVVPAYDSVKWKFHPFSGAIYNNKVWGRGAIDCKGLAVIQMMALFSFIEKAKSNSYPYNVTLLCVSGEETNSKYGAELITKTYLNDLNPLVVFGEGGSGVNNIFTSDINKPIFGISVAEKRSLWLKLEIHSESFGHGASSSDLYANKKLLRTLIKVMDEKKRIKFDPVLINMFKQLGTLEKGFKGFVIRHINWDIFWPIVRHQFNEGEFLNLLTYNTITITNISNPKSSPNQMADKATAIIDCRLLPGTDSLKFLKKFKNIVGPKVKVSVLSISPEAPSSPIDSFYISMEKAIHKIYPECEVIPMLFPATSDNNYFRKEGINTYGILPSIITIEQIESVHNNDEHISIEGLKKGIDVYIEFIRSVNEVPLSE